MLLASGGTSVLFAYVVNTRFPTSIDFCAKPEYPTYLDEYNGYNGENNRYRNGENSHGTENGLKGLLGGFHSSSSSHEKLGVES